MFNKSFPGNRNEESCCNPFAIGNRRDLMEQHDAELARDLARDMNALTVSERARALDDIHGVAKVQEETPQLLEKSLKALEAAVAKLAAKEKRAMSRAFFLRPLLEDDTKFKLMFLRADEYNAEKAAARMARYFQEKTRLFGEQKLANTITINDLSPSDLLVFQAGHLAVFPLEDQVGRPILFVDTGKADFHRMTSENMARAFWYMAMSVVKNDEMGQKKGLCALIYNSGKSLLATDTIGKATVHTIKSAAAIASIPFRYSSMHFCYNDARLEFLLKAMRVSNTNNHRSRLMTHFGSELENEYKLMTFGIPALHVMQSAKVGQSTITPQYTQQRVQIDQAILREEEQREQDTGIIEYPKPQDVLIGRGAPYREFSGTMIWDRLILTHLTRYQESSNFEKTCLTMDMIKMIQDSNGRFLQRTNNGWRVLEDSVAREKAAIAFRSRAKAASAQQQQQHYSSRPFGTKSNKHATIAKRLRVS